MLPMFVFLVAVLVVAFLLGYFVYIRKGKKRIAFYDAISMRGRTYNTVMLGFLLAGIGYIIAIPFGFLLMLMGQLDSIATALGGMVAIFAILVLGAVLSLSVGLCLYRHVLRKVPDDARHTFFKDAIMAKHTVGVMALLRLAVWWEYRPIAYHINGKVCYAYGRSGRGLYDEHGYKVGTKESSGRATMSDIRYQ